MLSTIYSLSDPRGGVRYVGVTKQAGRRRLNAHILRAKRGESGHKNNWIRELLAKSELPTMAVLEVVHGDAWKAAERQWIAHFRALGVDLTNKTIGGEGCEGYRHSEAVRSELRIRMLGKSLTTEHKARIGAQLRGRKKSEAHREKMLGRRINEETRARMSAAQKGHPVSQETLVKMSLTRKGKPLSAKARASRPQKLSANHRQAISSALRKAYSEGRRSSADRKSQLSFMDFLVPKDRSDSSESRTAEGS